MRKLAIFTEGQTEQLFCERLVRHLSQGRRLAVQVRVMEGGRGLNPRRVVEVRGDTESGQHAFFVLMVNCGQDQRVLSEVREQYARLGRTGYECIFAVRDVSPRPREHVATLRASFARYVPRVPIPARLILAIMEIEAWFLAEDTHFARLHRDLSADRVASELEFNPRTDDMQLRDRPSRDLADAYFLVQVIYDKSRERVSRTLDCLDFEAVSTTLCAKFPDLEALVGGVVEFLSRDLEGSSGPTSPN